MKKGKLKLSPEQWTLEEFEKIQGFRERAAASGEEFANIDAWENIMSVCGMSPEEFDKHSPAEFLQLIKKVSFDGMKKHPQSITVDGVRFIAFEKGDKFRVSAREAGAIERITKAKGGVTYPEIIAALLIEEGEDLKLRLSAESINRKAAILKKMKASEAVPFLASWVEACAEVVKIGIDETAKELE